MKYKLPAYSIILLVTACASSGHHHHAKENSENPSKAVIAAMDSNGDNQVSWQENQQYFDKLFTRLDVNHDRFITAEEFKAVNDDPVFKAMPLQKLQVSFSMFDRNDDGKLSPDEFEHMGDRIFTLLDRNMDGIISESDFSGSSESCDSSEIRSGSKGGSRRSGGGF